MFSLRKVGDGVTQWVRFKESGNYIKPRSKVRNQHLTHLVIEHRTFCENELMDSMLVSESLKCVEMWRQTLPK